MCGAKLARTIAITPAANQIGATTITLTVEDDTERSSSVSFQVTVVDEVICPNNVSWPEACLLNLVPIAANKKSISIDQSLD